MKQCCAITGITCVVNTILVNTTKLINTITIYFKLNNWTDKCNIDAAVVEGGLHLGIGEENLKEWC